MWLVGFRTSADQWPIARRSRTRYWYKSSGSNAGRVKVANNHRQWRNYVYAYVLFPCRSQHLHRSRQANGLSSWADCITSRSPQTWHLAYYLGHSTNIMGFPLTNLSYLVVEVSMWSFTFWPRQSLFFYIQFLVPFLLK